MIFSLLEHDLLGKPVSAFLRLYPNWLIQNGFFQDCGSRDRCHNPAKKLCRKPFPNPPRIGTYRPHPMADPAYGLKPSQEAFGMDRRHSRVSARNTRHFPTGSHQLTRG
ncbi:MAG: hypothetical protein E6833_26170, partial [Bradyrhizobium sp.]|nr:hypothetical protein [Bradyrhizobium sp.]